MAVRVCNANSEALPFPEPKLLGAIPSAKELEMAKYSKGDHVSWNSEAGRVTGRIIKIHEKDFQYKGHPRRASRNSPQYEIASDKTDHIAAHKEETLTKID